MDYKKIKKLIKIAKEEQLKALSYEEEGSKVHIETHFAGSEIATPIAPAPVMATAAEVSEKSSSQDGQYHVIKSPFVGTFYLAPSPEEPPFVQVGDRITEGKVLCIVEAMKIMNEIEADISGEIVEVCVKNENFVEYDEVLFKVKV